MLHHELTIGVADEERITYETEAVDVARNIQDLRLIPSKSSIPPVVLKMDYLSREAKGKRNPVQVLDAWADRRPEKIHVSVLKSANVSDGFHDWTHRQIRDAADTFAWWLCDTYGKSQKCETICYVGHNDLRYAVVFFGAIKAGYKVCQDLSLLGSEVCKG